MEKEEFINNGREDLTRDRKLERDLKDLTWNLDTFFDALVAIKDSDDIVFIKIY